MKRAILSLIPLLILSGCCAFPKSAKDLTETEKVTIEIVKVTQGPEKGGDQDLKWHVYVRFYEETKYNAVVQIVEIDDGSVLVEAFKLENGRFPMCYFDHHSSDRYQHRTMFVYPATVVGADWTPQGFAQLTRSEAGEVTNIGKQFNESYNKNHKTTGYVLEGDRSLGFTWYIHATEDKIDPITPPEKTVNP